MNMVVLRWEWIALLRDVFFTADMASINPRVRRCRSWYMKRVKVNTIVLLQKIDVFILRHSYNRVAQPVGGYLHTTASSTSYPLASHPA
jgi:hypothetical protein